MTAHAFLPPSGAKAWSLCAAWPSMNQQFPQDDSPESIEGTAAHWVVTELVAGRSYSEGHTAPNGVVITGEMLDGAELVLDTVKARMPGMRLHIEELLTMFKIHPECFGTPDIWGRTGMSKHIEIIDYKFGHGFVDEYFNLQGLLYLAGVLEKEYNGEQFPVDVTVSFTIIQPRCYHRGEPVRTHSFSVREIPPYMIKLRDAAVAAMMPNPTATTNSECGHCPGRHACNALQQAAYSDAEFSNDRQPHNLTPQAAALELRMLERALSRLEARVDGLRELTLSNLKRGARVSHYRAESGKGRQQWNAPMEQIITIGKMLGKDLSKPGIVTPNQAKKYIDESVIIAYSSIIPGATKLVLENNQDASRVFSK